MARPATADLDDPTVVDEICARLIAGEGIAQIGKSDHLPAASTIYRKMAEDEEFRTRIARAREAQQEAIIDETVDLADTATPDDWQVVKLRIWARQWRASKLAPKKYGDKLDLTTGGDKLGREVNEIEAVTRLASLASRILDRAEHGSDE
jgi:hypothetical protein